MMDTLLMSTQLEKYSTFRLTHISLASHKGDTDKQCRPRSDAAASDQGLPCLHYRK